MNASERMQTRVAGVTNRTGVGAHLVRLLVEVCVAIEELAGAVDRLATTSPNKGLARPTVRSQQERARAVIPDEPWRHRGGQR